MCLSVFVKVSHGNTENFRHLTDSCTAQHKRDNKTCEASHLQKKRCTSSTHKYCYLLSSEVVCLYGLACFCGNSPYWENALRVEQLQVLRHKHHICWNITLHTVRIYSNKALPSPASLLYNVTNIQQFAQDRMQTNNYLALTRNTCWSCSALNMRVDRRMTRE